jgi:hypothetical protein
VHQIPRKPVLASSEMFRLIQQAPNLTQQEKAALTNEVHAGNALTHMIFEYYAQNGDLEFLQRRLKNAI